MYNQKVLEIFKNPNNAGGLHGANGTAKLVDKNCGDVFKFYLKINKDTNVIEEAKFKTMGCVASIVCSSVLTELVTNKGIEQAKLLTSQDIINVLGELPSEKMFLADTCIETLNHAILDYFKKLEREQKAQEKKNI